MPKIEGIERCFRSKCRARPSVSFFLNWIRVGGRNMRGVQARDRCGLSRSVDWSYILPQDIGASRVPAGTSSQKARLHNLGLTDEIRSEEHTSELQSLMRISYAVFCLQKKKKNRNIIQIPT